MLKKESDHPLKAIVEYIGDIKYTKKQMFVKGGGIVAHVEGHKVAGNVALMEQKKIFF